ncbi:NAD(P)-dependent dehydrogenase (short-subunit alcohol dehydrogenase family) [Bradyrhizobium sp. USDA 4503]
MRAVGGEIGGIANEFRLIIVGIRLLANAETAMHGKAIVITGALGALGKVVATEALARGARVAGIDHAASTLAATADHMELGGVDLTDTAQATAAIDKAAAHFGRLDGLINIAGGFTFEAVGDGDPATWQRMYAMNVMTALNTSRAAIPHLTKSGAGRIINIGALGALQAASGMGPLCRLEGRRAPPYRVARCGTEGQGHGQRGVALDHRHRRQSRCDAAGRHLQMGDAERARPGDPVPRQRCRERRHRRAAAGERAGLDALPLPDAFRVDLADAICS